MRRILSYIVCIPLLFLSSCDVHEWPEVPEFVPFHLNLSYNTDMTYWEHLYDGESTQEVSKGPVVTSRRGYGMIRYIVRAYPVTQERRAALDYNREFIFTRDITEGYELEATLNLAPGNYRIMVWSDLVQVSSDQPFHNADNFGEITLQGKHLGNNEYRDAFRGTGDITLVSDIMERLPDTLNISMSRPMAKYELITNDVEKFVLNEITRAEAKSKAEGKDTEIETKVNLDDYRIVFHYVGFMPDTYSMFTDKPVDSSTGIKFESGIRSLGNGEASLGFDYVMMNGKESAVTVQIGIYDKEGEQITMGEPIKVPLMRSHHTILKGMFLVSEASGGININPEYDGDHNLIF